MLWFDMATKFPNQISNLDATIPILKLPRMTLPLPNWIMRTKRHQFQPMHRWVNALCALWISFLGASSGLAKSDDTEAQRQADQWRIERRIIDMHQHLQYTPALLDQAIRVMDRSGIGIGVDLTPGTVTPGPNGAPSSFERNRQLQEERHPGRWIQYMNLDYKNWDQPDFAEQAVRQVERGYELGAAGLKEWKRLGLFLRDGAGKLIKIDDPKLDPMWERLGELNLPVSLHVGDPKAFFEPYNEQNERWAELKDHPSWWFGDTNKFPTFHEILEAMLNVVAKHPHTKFVCVHFANNAEELDWVDAALARHPNLYADLAARIPEIGRHDPDRVRRLFVKHQDRILFGTDFQSLSSRMILGSSGSEPPPSEADAETFFLKEWRWLETRDKNWPHMTPIQGDWTISSIGLPASVLRKIYFDNARQLLGRSMPLPHLQARRISQDFDPAQQTDETLWQTTSPVTLEYQAKDYAARPELATTVRALWSAKALYLRYECPYTKLTLFEPAQFDRERHNMDEPGVSLWDRDVVEAFIAGDPNDLHRYVELQVAPTNEKLDLTLNHGQRDFAWSSGFQTAVRVDRKAKVWTCKMRIPLSSLAPTQPKAGTQWRIGLYRGDIANRAGLAFSPTLSSTFHKPEKFGMLEFVE